MPEESLPIEKSPTEPSTTKGSALVEMRGVSQEFILPNGKPLEVFQDIQLEVHQDEVVAILGPSGCGKSTLLRVLSGLIAPSQGKVLYRGKPLKGLNPGVSVVFQSSALFPWMTVSQNVQAVLEPLRLSPAEIDEKVQWVLQLVGLSGFEEAYPRELSGGMRQRVGIARALSVTPEVLIMDQPFSQVDTLTAEALRAEVIDIWAAQHKNPSSILLVTNDIKEAIYMADRVVLLASKPGRILKVVENKLSRPRDYRSPEFLKMVDQLHEIISGHEIPDEPQMDFPTEGFAAAEPLPDATPSEMLGLVEYLDARGGKEELFRIATETDREFGDILKVVKALELLDLVDTPKRLVTLTPDGARFVKARPSERQAIWKEQLLKLRLFKQVFDMLSKHPRKKLDAELAQEVIIFNLPTENFERTFETFVRWSRFGNLFAYEEGEHKLSFPRKRPPRAPKPKPTAEQVPSGTEGTLPSQPPPPEDGEGPKT